MKLMPAAASKTLAAWHARWDKLGLREQLLVLGATAGVGLAVIDSALWQPQSRLHQQLNQRIAALETERDELDRRARKAGVGAGELAKFEAGLRRRLAETEQRLEAARAGITGSEQMLQRLRHLAGEGSGVTLAGLVAEPAEAITLGAPSVASGNLSATPATAPGNGSVDAPSGGVVPGPGVVARAGGTDPGTLYRLPLKATLEGDYASLHTYLRQLETQAPALHWRQIELQAQQWPRLQLRLQVFTLAEQPHWEFR